ncbi:hypothetical protein HPB52_009825 [Rhipicephalus sanguineus]|uniref:CW-type domain-containing protein n=1 Tax=Rhipicephalus sanguineus TaxID=34632 RepID=A0A9D4PPC2_RHISA|nr:hypothetical protein HPB52_009825 [Rhipicephalus sanguineus]
MLNVRPRFGDTQLVGGASLPSMRTARSATTRIIRTKPGYAEYWNWREHWSRNARSEASLRPFMAEQVLPFWAQCVRSRKWRRLPKGDDLTPEFVGSFTCGDIPSYDDSTEDTKTDDCSVPEDPDHRKDSQIIQVNEHFIERLAELIH